MTTIIFDLHDCSLSYSFWPQAREAPQTLWRNLLKERTKKVNKYFVSLSNVMFCTVMFL
jgi:hypothetical protein